MSDGLLKKKKLKDYSQYRIEDLLLEDDFLEYVLNPTPENEVFWGQLAGNNPELSGRIENARWFILKLHAEKMKMEAEEMDETWKNIQQGCKGKSRRLYWLGIAAACFISIFTMAALWFWGSVSDNVSAIELVSKPSVIANDVQLVLADNQTKAIEGDDSSLDYDTKGQVRINNGAEKIDQEIKAEKKQQVFNQLIVPKGKRSSITFLDGSRVWVNAGTRVVYPVEFAEDKREIYVEGEIYLEVARNEACPFYVKTKQFEVQVLGTCFDVRAYDEEETAHVVLVSGKVNVITKQKQETRLSPNDMFVCKDGKGIVKWVDTYEYVSWKDGVLCFERSGMGVILERLSKYYGVLISYDESVKRISCSGKLELKKEVGEVLRSLSKTAPITYEIVGEAIKISKK